MAIRYYLSPIIGTGSYDDPIRPKLADTGVSYVTLIATIGHPSGAKTWCLCSVESTDFAALEADSALGKFPSADATALISSFSNGVRNQLQNQFDSRGIPLTVNSFNTLGDLITALGQLFEPGFSLAGFRNSGS